jgi:hypothetical protein
MRWPRARQSRARLRSGGALISKYGLIRQRGETNQARLARGGVAVCRGMRRRDRSQGGGGAMPVSTALQRADEALLAEPGTAWMRIVPTAQ